MVIVRLVGILSGISMAKELPYFRFTPQEWQNGNISLESYELRGLFVDVCCYYWVKDCSITLALLKKRFSNDIKLLNQLIKLEIITKENDKGFMSISFLDKQYDLLSERRQRRQIAGAKGGKKKSSNAKAKLKQSSSYKDKDKYKDKIKNKIIITVNETLSVNDVNKRTYFADWLDYRKKIKKPITIEATFDSLVKTFNSESIEKIRWVVNHSIQNGYQGLFWDKYTEKTSQPKKKRVINHYEYKCPNCSKLFKPREMKGDDDAFPYRCDENGCQTVGLGKDGKNMVGVQLEFVKKVSKEK